MYTMYVMIVGQWITTLKGFNPINFQTQTPDYEPIISLRDVKRPTGFLSELREKGFQKSPGNYLTEHVTGLSIKQDYNLSLLSVRSNADEAFEPIAKEYFMKIPMPFLVELRKREIIDELYSKVKFNITKKELRYRLEHDIRISYESKCL